MIRRLGFPETGGRPSFLQLASGSLGRRGGGTVVRTVGGGGSWMDGWLRIEPPVATDVECAGIF